MMKRLYDALEEEKARGTRFDIVLGGFLRDLASCKAWTRPLFLYGSTGCKWWAHQQILHWPSEALCAGRPSLQGSLLSATLPICGLTSE